MSTIPPSGRSTPAARLAQVASHIQSAPINADPLPADNVPQVAESEASPPALVLLFGWAMAPPRAVEKYATRYRTLFPQANVVVFTSDYDDFMPQPGRQTGRSQRGLDELLAAADALTAADSVLVHVNSGGGALRFAQLATAYHEKTRKRLPIRLLLCDSAPTAITLLSLARYLQSEGVSPSHHPWWRRTLTQPVAMAWLILSWAWGQNRGRPVPMQLQWDTLLNPAIVPTEALRGYIYSTADDLVPYGDIERHMALARAKGLRVEHVRLEDSPHVGHAKLYPELYWNFVQSLWQKSAAQI